MDCRAKPLASVAIIGGIFAAWIRTVLVSQAPTPTARPTVRFPARPLMTTSEANADKTITPKSRDDEHLRNANQDVKSFRIEARRK